MARFVSSNKDDFYDDYNFFSDSPFKAVLEVPDPASIEREIQDVADENMLKTFDLRKVEVLGRNLYYGFYEVNVFISSSVTEELRVKRLFPTFEEVIKNIFEKTPICIHFDFIATAPIDEAYRELKKAGKVKEENNMKQIPEVKKIIHSGDYTHVIWEDDTKTSVKRAKDSFNDPYSAFAQAVLKKLYGSTEKAKFEHEIKQKSVKEQKKILAEKEARRAKQQKREERKISKELARQEKELEEKKKEVEKCREKKRRIVSRKDNN